MQSCLESSKFKADVASVHADSSGFMVDVSSVNESNIRALLVLSGNMRVCSAMLESLLCVKLK